MLRGMGAVVSTVVNSGAAAAQAHSQGHIPIFFEQMEAHLNSANVIFNTVPEILLHKDNMRHIRKDTLIIDLASPPYGVDVTDGITHGLRVLYSNSLPGKIAPVTTAGYIRETLRQIIDELDAIRKAG